MIFWKSSVSLSCIYRKSDSDIAQVAKTSMGARLADIQATRIILNDTGGALPGEVESTRGGARGGAAATT